MKHYRSIQILLLLAILPFWSMGDRVSGTALAASQNVNQAVHDGPVGLSGGDWTPTFYDDFDGNTLNRTVWRNDYLNGGNGELQEYADDDSHNNYLVQNGVLSLVARNEYLAGKQYSSGIITTRDRFFQQYGYFEIRAKMPAGKGLWPAFWLMPESSAWPPEIDVVEHRGHEKTTAYMSVWFANPKGYDTSYYIGPDFSAGWHTFGVEWSPSAIIWYVDGAEQKRFTDSTRIPHEAMFMLADLAVGGNWPGSPDGSTVFPASYDIDYIRAWQKTPPTPLPPPDPGPQAVTITYPVDGGAVPPKYRVRITADVSGNPSKVVFRINGKIKCKDKSAPFACYWKVPSKLSRYYTIQAIAYYIDGNTAVSTVSVVSQ